MLSTCMAFWCTETKHVICFVILCLIRCPFHMHWYVHLVLIPSFLSASKQKQQKHKIHLPCSNWSEYSPNGSNVKIPLYCSIFGRDKRRLITGRPCIWGSKDCAQRGSYRDYHYGQISPFLLVTVIEKWVWWNNFAAGSQVFTIQSEWIAFHSFFAQSSHEGLSNQQHPSDANANDKIRPQNRARLPNRRTRTVGQNCGANDRGARALRPHPITSQRTCGFWIHSVLIMPHGISKPTNVVVMSNKSAF